MDAAGVGVHEVGISDAIACILKTQSGESKARDGRNVARASIGRRRDTVGEVVL